MQIQFDNDSFVDNCKWTLSKTRVAYSAPALVQEK